MKYKAQANSRIPARTFRELHDWQMARCPVWAVAQARPSGDGRWVSTLYLVQEKQCAADHEVHETQRSAMASACGAMREVRRRWRRGERG